MYIIWFIEIAELRSVILSPPLATVDCAVDLYLAFA